MWPAALVVLVFSIALAAKPQLGDSWFWEIGNGIGFLALALLLVVILNGRGKHGHSLDHRWLGVVAFSTVFAHIVWLLIGDPIIWEYLKWGAPHYMVAGLMSAGLLLLVTVSSLVSLRNTSYNGHKSFRRWHSWLSILIVVTALAHIVFSRFYIEHNWQVAALILLGLSAYIVPSKFNIKTSFTRRNIAIVSLLALAIFCLIRMSAKL